MIFFTKSVLCRVLVTEILSRVVWMFKFRNAVRGVACETRAPLATSKLGKLQGLVCCGAGARFLLSHPTACDAAQRQVAGSLE